MFTTTNTTGKTRGQGATKRHLLTVAAGGLLLASGTLAGAVWWTHAGKPTLRATPNSPAVQSAGGNLSQAATRGGVSDSFPNGSVSAVPPGGNLSQVDTRGGVADTMHLSVAANPVLRFGALEGGSSADPAAPSQFEPAATAAGTALPGLPMGGVAEWLLWRSEAGMSATP